MKQFIAAAFVFSSYGTILWADHDKPRYQWPDASYYCEEAGKALSETDFIVAALDYAWDRDGDAWRQDWPTSDSWLAANPDCCSAQIKDNNWELEERHTQGWFGWLEVLLHSPTILVHLKVPEADRHYPDNLRTITYLLNVCGWQKDQMG